MTVRVVFYFIFRGEVPLLSDSPCKADSVVPPVELHIVAADEVGTKDPDGTSGRGHIQT